MSTEHKGNKKMSSYMHTPAAMPYRRGIFKEEMEYESLTISQMSEKDRKYVLKALPNINDRKDIEKLTTEVEGWSYTTFDMYGRVGILKYKGIEVAFFVKRQTTKRRIDIEHPVSEAKLKDPKDAWMRFDLFGLSAQQSRRPTVELINRQQKEIEKLQQKVATQAALLDQLDAEVKRANKKNKRKAKSTGKDDKTSKRKASRHSKVVKRSSKGRR